MAGTWNIKDLGKTWGTLSPAVQSSLREAGVEPPPPQATTSRFAGYQVVDPACREMVRQRLFAVKLALEAGKTDQASQQIRALLEVL